MELLEIPGEPRGESGPLLADGRAHGQHSRGGDGVGAGNHPEETGGAMMRLGGGGVATLHADGSRAGTWMRGL